MTRDDRIAAVAAMRKLELLALPRVTGEIVVGDYVFADKAEALSMTRKIIAAVMANGMTDAAQAFFQALANNHPAIHEKVGNRPYCVEPTGYRYDRVSKVVGLHIFFTDRPDWKIDREAYRRHQAKYTNNSIALGVDACLRTVPHHVRVKAAARMMAGKPYVSYSANRFFSTDPVPVAHLDCAICGNFIALDDLHWDHHPHGFADIFREWRIQMLLRWEDIELSRHNQHRFANSNLCESWGRFHDQFANFRPTCSKCNLTDQNRRPIILSEDQWQDWLRESGEVL
nr:hypothetical protein [Sphingomonas melonis]